MRFWRAVAVTILFTGIGGAAYAQTEDLGIYNDCKVFAETVEQMMLARQAGVDLSELLSIASSTPPVDLWTGIAKAAFDVPRYQSKEIQLDAAKDFRDPFELSCYNGREAALARRQESVASQQPSLPANSEIPLASEAPDEDAQKVIELWNAANSQCRGGYPDEPVTEAACEAREVYEPYANQLGWCYGVTAEFGYQQKWERCPG